jgi:hypothetical protein
MIAIFVITVSCHILNISASMIIDDNISGQVLFF